MEPRHDIALVMRYGHWITRRSSSWTQTMANKDQIPHLTACLLCPSTSLLSVYNLAGLPRGTESFLLSLRNTHTCTQTRTHTGMHAHIHRWGDQIQEVQFLIVTLINCIVLNFPTWSVSNGKTSPSLLLFSLHCLAHAGWALHLWATALGSAPCLSGRIL